MMNQEEKEKQNTKMKQRGFAFECNFQSSCFFMQERVKQNISRERLAKGVMSRRNLAKMEEGVIGWNKWAGDFMLQRMGISTQYFNVVVPTEELKRWRLREDICIKSLQEPMESKKLCLKYKRCYPKQSNMERLFLAKMELLSLRSEMNSMEATQIELYLQKAKQAVSYTAKGDWNYEMQKQLLAPDELEAILLVTWLTWKKGIREEAWRLWNEVWKYPQLHAWEKREMVLILPQAALLGMYFYRQQGEQMNAYALGEQAVELAREVFAQRYVLQILDQLLILTDISESQKEKQVEWKRYQQMFERSYALVGNPRYRIWQGVGVSEVYELGYLLRMLRRSSGWSVQKCVDLMGKDYAVQNRQLEKIEAGLHKPSYENYRKLAALYNKPLEWKIPILETDSAEILALRQDICMLIALEEWDFVEKKVKELRGKIDEKLPKNRQELLFFEALLQVHRGEITWNELIVKLSEALSYTFSDMKDKKLNLWIYLQEEAVIICNIGWAYMQEGDLKRAEKYYQMLEETMRCQMRTTQIAGNAYQVLYSKYANLLGNQGFYEKSIEMNREGLKQSFNGDIINKVEHYLYNWTWDLYEIAQRYPERQIECKKLWRQTFQLTQAFAAFWKNTSYMKFLQEKENKYLS